MIVTTLSADRTEKLPSNQGCLLSAHSEPSAFQPPFKCDDFVWSFWMSSLFYFILIFFAGCPHSQISHSLQMSPFCLCFVSPNIRATVTSFRCSNHFQSPPKHKHPDRYCNPVRYDLHSTCFKCKVRCPGDNGETGFQELGCLPSSSRRNP